MPSATRYTVSPKGSLRWLTPTDMLLPAKRLAMLSRHIGNTTLIQLILIQQSAHLNFRKHRVFKLVNRPVLGAEMEGVSQTPATSSLACFPSTCRIGLQTIGFINPIEQ